MIQTDRREGTRLRLKQGTLCERLHVRQPVKQVALGGSSVGAAVSRYTSQRFQN